MNDANITGTLILNVDDYVPGRYARSRLLRQTGFQVIEAGTGQETLELAEQHNPSMVLLDVNLPDMTGFEVCRQLRRNPKTAGLPILHISASSILAQHQVIGLEAGADGYLVEPVEPSVLIATVNAFLRIRRAEEALRKSNDELRWFSYRVGHDTGEPLRTITAYAQLLKVKLGTEQDDETLKLLDFITDGAFKLRSFMDGLLEYSQVAAGVHETKAMECEEMLARVVANLDSAIRDSSARITYDPMPKVMANDQLECVFQNLIGNAIKYGKPGVAPEIHVGVRREPKAWVFSVADNGVGIEAGDVERIFEIFHRLHGHEIHGNGIGLALARRIVESFGGRIWVEASGEDQASSGSVFYLTLPADLAGAEAAVKVHGAGSVPA